MQFDAGQIKRSFENAAAHYDEAATLQREVAERMLERLEYIRISPKTILDVGSGTGYCAQWLARHYPTASIIGIDLAEQMCLHARDRMQGSPFASACGDVQALPVADNSIDLLVSNLTLQWCNNLELAIAEMGRVLKPGGLMLFTTFGTDTLHELRSAWAQADGHEHVNQFIDMHTIGDMIGAHGMQDVVMDVDRLQEQVNDVYELMRGLKAIGAHNVQQQRKHTLTGKGRLNRMVQGYEGFRMQNGKLPASYEVVYAHAWAMEEPGVIPVQTMFRR